MKEYSRYKYNIQDNNPPCLHFWHLILVTAHTHRYTLDSCLMRQGRCRVSETLQHTSHWLQGRRDASVAQDMRECVCARVSERARVCRRDVALLWQGYRVGLEYRWRRRWREWRSSHSVCLGSLSILPQSSLSLWSRQCVSQVSLLSLVCRHKNRY